MNKKEFIAAADDIREVLPIIARQLWAYYRELIDAGFDARQALKIVIAHGLNPGGMK